jgi:hypothetical protein
MLVSNWMVLFGNFFIAKKRSFGLEYKDEDHYIDNRMVGVPTQHNKPCAKQICL